MVSYADQLYLMQLEFQKSEGDRREATARDFEAIRAEEKRLEAEREARQEQTDATAEQGSWEPWQPREFQIGYDEDDE